MDTYQDAHQIEPGLLKVFRLTVGVQLALTAFVFCAESDNSEQGSSFLAVFALIMSAALLVMLSWRRLRRWWGRWFLLVTLTTAAAGPVIGTAISVAIRIDGGITGDAAYPDAGGLLLWLLVPLLLVSSQYRMRVMFSFTLGTAALDFVLMLWLSVLDGPNLGRVTEEIFIRVLIYSIVGYVVVRLTTASREQRHVLAQKNAELAQFATTSEQLTVSRERNRMARELHDTLAHTLSALSVQLQALEVLMDTDPAAARAALGDLQAATRQGVQEARRALRALRASPLEDLGLPLALRRLAEMTAHRAGLVLTLDIPDQVDHVPSDISPDVEQHVYRIAEEALTNVVRHADAHALTVRLQQDRRGGLILEIADDGVGFDLAAARIGEHYGLKGIRERAQLIGGDLRITGQPGRGVNLTLCITKDEP